MDKTININLGGTLFQIDEEAFRILRDYLQALNIRFRNVHGGLETIEDIESRIAEIFQSQKGIAGVITKDNVEAMISIIGKPEDFDINEQEREAPLYHPDKRRLFRNPDDFIVSGVCGGLGAYFDIDPVVFRILFALSALFGVGFFVYIILWIALPKARTESQKKEMYGTSFYATAPENTKYEDSHVPAAAIYSPGYRSQSRLGNGINEIFRAIGKVLFICLRIILIIIGVSLVLTGFLAILSFVMVFVFKYPGSFSHEGIGLNLAYLPDFMNYIVNPSVTPWIMALTAIAFILPMLALIYWGVKMIFWFKARDGIFNLAGLVLWVMTIAALAIILFNEGVSFAESASTTSENILPKSMDTLYVMIDHKFADLKYDKEFLMPDGDYNVFLVDSTKRIYIRPQLKLKVSDDKLSKIVIRKRSSGRTTQEATKKSGTLIYNYRTSRDTVYLDEYFTIPPGNKWTADFVTVNLTLPEKTVLFFDPSVRELFHKRIEITRIDNEITHSSIDFNTEPWELRNKYWVISDHGLKEAEKTSARRK